MEEETLSNAGAVIQAVTRLSEIEELTVPGADERPTLVFAVPEGKSLVPAKPFLDALRETPRFRVGTARLHDLGSFIDHAMRFRSERQSAIFADRDVPRLISVLDYHEGGEAGDPANCTHRGEYLFPISEEWTRWQGKNRAQMSQAEFAEFIEGGILDLLPPEAAGASSADFAARLGVTFASPQRLMEVSRGLTVRVQEKVASAVTLQTGEVQLQYTSAHADEAGSPLKIPAAFLLGIPVFQRGEAFQLAARLRYRVREGSISWWFELWRPDRVFDTAVDDAARAAEEATGLPLFFGTPER